MCGVWEQGPLALPVQTQDADLDAQNQQFCQINFINPDEFQTPRQRIVPSPAKAGAPAASQSYSARI